MQLGITIVLHHDHAPLQTQLPEKYTRIWKFRAVCHSFFNRLEWSRIFILFILSALKLALINIVIYGCLRRMWSIDMVNNIIESTTIELNFLKTLLLSLLEGLVNFRRLCVCHISTLNKCVIPFSFLSMMKYIVESNIELECMHVNETLF